MKAIVIHEYGPPDVLRYEDLPDPAAARRRNPHPHPRRDRQPRARRERARRPGRLSASRCCRSSRASTARASSTRSGPASRTWRKGMRVAAAGMMPLDRLRGERQGLCRPGRHDGHQAPGRLRRTGRGAGLRGDRAARHPRFPPRRRRHAPRADRLEPAVQRRPAQGRRDRADHGRRRQSRHASASRSPRT